MESVPEIWLFSRGPDILFISVLLSAARPLALIFVLPLFTRFGLQQGLIQGAIMVAFAAPVFPGVSSAVGALPPLPLALLALLLLKELLIGLLLGLILGIPLWAVVAAGDIIDMQRGASIATLVDPGSGEETTVTGTLLFLLAALLLISAGWFTEVILTSLYESYTTFPILAVTGDLQVQAGAGALNLLDKLLETGLILAIPVLGPLFLAEVALGLAARYTQQLNVMFLSMSLKQVIYIFLLPVYFGALIFYVRQNLGDLTSTSIFLRSFLGP
jgi:type III secretion protein T